MDEYIKREALIQKLQDEINSCPFYGHQFDLEDAKELIRNFPAADVAPVVRGRWIPAEPESDVIFICSKCETEISTSWDYDQDEMWNYCPICGAKMDKEDG